MNNYMNIKYGNLQECLYEIFMNAYVNSKMIVNSKMNTYMKSQIGIKMIIQIKTQMDFQMSIIILAYIKAHTNIYLNIFVGQGMTKSPNLKIFQSQYLNEFLRYGPDFLHVIRNFIGFKKTFSNMGSQPKTAPTRIQLGI